jgi:hypothetical protein
MRQFNDQSGICRRDSLYRASARAIYARQSGRSQLRGPGQNRANTKVSALPQALDVAATKQGWFVISMKSDWKKIFAFEQ